MVRVYFPTLRRSEGGQWQLIMWADEAAELVAVLAGAAARAVRHLDESHQQCETNRST